MTFSPNFIRFAVVCLIVLIECGVCAKSLDVLCKPKDKLKKYVCEIAEWPSLPSTSNQNSYHFRVDYAEYNDIRELNVMNAANELISVKRIPAEVFTTFPNLKTFRINSNVSELHSHDFVNATELRTLDLSENDIAMIHYTIFSAAARKALSAQPRIKITEVVLDDTYSLHELETLLLNHNRISEIDSYSFYGLSKLTTLDLRNNRLSDYRRWIISI